MPRRPTYDDLIARDAAFIGPPPPPQIPKFTRAADRDAVYKMMLENLIDEIAETSRFTKE